MTTKKIKPVKAPKKHATSTTADTEMDPRSLEVAMTSAKAVIEKKALQTIILDVGSSGSFADFFLISSGTNERQVQAMADEAMFQLKALGLTPKMEGYDSGRWVLVDAGAVILHLFHDDIRGFYKLEELWAGAPHVAIPQEYYSTPTRQ